jgi:hypothetical protein
MTVSATWKVAPLAEAGGLTVRTLRRHLDADQIQTLRTRAAA